MKRVGVFTKTEMVGGSEFRAIELANGISRTDGYRAVLLSTSAMPPRLLASLEPIVELHSDIFRQRKTDVLYSLDHLLVINSDSRNFTTENYWKGKSDKHSEVVELERIPGMTFLFNYIVSPACRLNELRKHIDNIQIITTNSKFFDEISEQDRYDSVRAFPRLRLESPIRPEGIVRQKTKSARVRFGMHSLPNRSKWNEDWPKLIREVNAVAPDRVSWSVMGMPSNVWEALSAESVTYRPAFHIPVSEFLQELDVFVFFLDWKREEAWARSSAEALMCGCPVITTAKGGNRDQVIHGNTGFLCRSFQDVVDSCIRLIEEPDLLRRMGSNATRLAKDFSTECVTRRLLNFLFAR